jgi:hypothetical protein
MQTDNDVSIFFRYNSSSLNSTVPIVGVSDASRGKIIKILVILPLMQKLITLRSDPPLFGWQALYPYAITMF